MKQIIPYSLFLIGLLALAGGRATAQTAAADSSCSYVNVNQLYPHKVLELHRAVVCFEYEDLYGRDSTLQMTFYDWRRKQIAALKVPKHYGKNAYSLNLQQLGLAYNGEHFTLEVINETGRPMESVFKLVPPPDMPDPEVEIFVNPVSLQCGAPKGNLIDFYGKIKGGKAPYEVEWTVTNGAQSSLLYRPGKVTVREPGTTPAVQVDHTPSYYVQLLVTDACGSQGRQIVHVRCQNQEDKANSLLFQPVPSLPPGGTPGTARPSAAPTPERPGF